MRIRSRHSSSTERTTSSGSRSAASQSRSRSKSRPVAAARPAIWRADGPSCSKRARRTASSPGERRSAAARSPPCRAASTTYSGKPPVAVPRTSTTSSGTSRRVRSRSSCPVSSGSNGASPISVSCPDARIRRAQSPCAVLELALAGGEGHQHRRLRLGGEEEGEEVQRLLVAPLEVLQHEQQRAPGRAQGPGQALEEPVALPGVDHAAGDVGTRRRGPRWARAGRPRPARPGAASPGPAASVGSESHSATGASARRPGTP